MKGAKREMEAHENTCGSYRISVIVPVYNTEKYLERCVESLTGQNWADLEILLVDDGSTDQSGTLCDRLASTDKRIRVIHKENGGLISSWKRGVQEATGAYVCFVDSDDWIDLTMFAEMGACLSGSKREIIASDYVIEKDNGRQQYVWQQLAPGEYTEEQLSREVVPRLLGYEQRYVCISRCMKLISRELICENMHYSDPAIRMGEDMTVMLPALIDCERLVIMDHKAYYHYLYVESSMVHKYDKGLYENIRLLLKIMLQVAEDKFAGEEKAHMAAQVQKEYVHLLMLALKNEARGNPSGYRKNIAAICRDPEVKRTVLENPVTVEQMSNQLLYAVLKHPNGMMIRLLRLAMILFYAKGEK